MPLLFDQEKNNIAECAEGVAPSTAQRQPLHRRAERQREQERQTHTHTHRQNNQEKRARENNETDTDKQQHSKRTRQDKRTTDC